MGETRAERHARLRDELLAEPRWEVVERLDMSGRPYSCEHRLVDGVWYYRPIRQTYKCTEDGVSWVGPRASK